MDDICELYFIDVDEIRSFIRKNSIRKILIQAPDGLKPLYRCIDKILQEFKDLDTYYSSSPSYGGCDVAYSEAQRIRVDGIIHVGHNRYPLLDRGIDIKTLYIPAFYNWSISSKLIDEIRSFLEKEGYRNVGLLASIQHVNTLEKLASSLRRLGFNAYIGKPVYREMFDGQILGCEYSSALSILKSVDVFLVVSGGKFHSLGLALFIDKPVYGIDPYRNTLWNASTEAKKYLAKRLYILSKLINQGFRRVGLIIGVKPGQYREELVKYLVNLSMREDIRVVKISSELLDLERMVSIDNAFNLDLYIVSSCPRIPIDDLNEFYKPVLTPGEYIMLIKKKLDKYIYPW
ncbi:MAG: diphthamide biosynthesis enzyme Dph2 [Desulfurococcales archaeon ex4484_58]|nr:MAG: diphthamide biosynthesis enzyme Dph2 [Desulfurococcales archaeon ex4484_58]